MLCFSIVESRYEIEFQFQDRINNEYGFHFQNKFPLKYPCGDPWRPSTGWADRIGGSRERPAVKPGCALPVLPEAGKGPTAHSDEEPLHSRDAETHHAGISSGPDSHERSECGFDPVGGDYAEPALRALRWGGRFLVIGFAAGEIPRVPLNLALLNTRSILGVDWGAFTVRDRDGNRRLLAELQELLATQKIRPAEPQCYPLERAGEALRDLAERRVVGKAVLTP